MPRKKLTTQDRLVSAAGRTKPPRATPAGGIDEMARALAHHDDVDAASALIREQAGHLYDAEHGRKHVQHQLDCEAIESRFQESESRLKTLDAKCANTARDIKANATHRRSADRVAGTGEAGDAAPIETAIPFKDWPLKDQVSLVMVWGAIVVALGMGGANVYANLMASGQPVFIEQPILAVFLSGLLPAGSTALKFISSFFEYSRTTSATRWWSTSSLPSSCWPGASPSR